MARNNANNTKSVREALAATTAATVNAVNAQNRAAETLPLTWRRAGTIVRTELASINSAAAAAAASLARLGAAANIHLAQASAMFTRFLGAMGSLASTAALLYMVVEGAKAIGDYAGLTSGKVGDLAKEFIKSHTFLVIRGPYAFGDRFTRALNTLNLKITKEFGVFYNNHVAHKGDDGKRLAAVVIEYSG